MTKAKQPEDHTGQEAAAPSAWNGQAVALDGYRLALNKCLRAIDGNKEAGEKAYCAGVITLMDKRVADIIVAVVVR